MNQIVATLEYYNSSDQAQTYLNKIKSTLPFYKELSVVNKSDLDKYNAFNIRDKYIVINKKSFIGLLQNKIQLQIYLKIFLRKQLIK